MLSVLFSVLNCDIFVFCVHEGLGQGIRRFFTFVGIIFGPLWGGSMIFHPTGLYGGALGVSIVAFVSFSLEIIPIVLIH